MSKIGRLEADITVPVGGWDISVDVGGGPVTITVDAGNYTPTELVDALEVELDDSMTWDVSISNGESGTGRVTIDSQDEPWSLTWTDTDFRDALGFTANITGVTTAQTGARSAVGIWLPGNPAKFTQYGDASAGTRVTDYAATVGPTGRVHALMGNQYVKHVGIRWEGVPSNRALAHFESIVGESFEAFFRDVATGRKSYVGINPLIRLTWDADVNGTYAEGRLLWPSTFDLEALVTGWTGRWNVRLPDLVIET